MTNASIFTPEYLSTLEGDRLREVAQGLGVELHHRAGDDKIRASILAVMQQNNPLTTAEHPRTPKAEILETYPTEDKIRAEAQKYAEKGMEIRFLDGGLNWHVRCKGAEDTGTTQQPMSEITRRFQAVSRGAFAPRIKVVDGQKMIIG